MVKRQYNGIVRIFVFEPTIREFPDLDFVFELRKVVEKRNLSPSVDRVRLEPSGWKYEGGHLTKSRECFIEFDAENSNRALEILADFERFVLAEFAQLGIIEGKGAWATRVQTYLRI